MNYPILLTLHGGNIDVSFCFCFVCNSSSSVFNRTSLSLLHTFVVDTLLNFPMRFNIILTYTNTSCLKAFRHLLVEYIERQKSLLKKFKKGFVSKSEKARAGKYD